MNKVAVIVGGGKGLRMGAEMPKQFLIVNNKPLLYYTVQAFINAYADIKIILVLPEEFIDFGQEVVDAYFEKENISIIAGGATRFESVKNGLSLIDEEAIVFVHDAVRCLVDESLIRRCYNLAVETGTAIPVIPTVDSLRTVTEDGNEVLDRNSVVIVQTPQVFHSKILLPAFNIDYKEKFTDEATVVEAFGMKVALVEGDAKNIKVTHPIDLVIAAQYLV